jgi:uncharacterized CHY-type Zn-finger protein|uniref:Uncharacterized protein n=1 Tax=viral metagenome TaxID=1070528 RepID=A0A6C0AQJ4_9ZZZZ
MNIAKRIDQYDNNSVILCDAIKNNIMTEGNFIRILYSTQNITLNGIYIVITLNNITCEKYFSKYRCFFNILSHKDLLDKLQIIEESILGKYRTIDKIPQYKIYEQIKNGNIKIFNDIGNKSVCSFILKISGIWETQTSYGLTYKFIKVN